jgi:hypothetical protein
MPPRRAPLGSSPVAEYVIWSRMRVIARLLRALASAACSSTGTGGQFQCLNYRGLHFWSTRIHRRICTRDSGIGVRRTRPG